MVVLTVMEVQGSLSKASLGKSTTPYLKNN
jgi:hypothetical protein